MKKVTLVSIILFLVFLTSVEAKGRKVGVAKTIAKSIPKIKQMITASKRSKLRANKLIRKRVPKIGGLYKFKASNNKPYLGKSFKTKNQNVQKRLTQHIRSGKLHPKDINTITYGKVLNKKTRKEVDKKTLGQVEKLKIMKADKNTHGNLANIQNAPRSNSKQKREMLAKEISKNKALLKTKF